MRPRSRHRAFTLVELLVVIGIVALLIAMLMPALNRARQAALRTTCASNLRQVGLATFQYVHDWQGTLPFGWGYPLPPDPPPPTNTDPLYHAAEFTKLLQDARYLGPNHERSVWWCPAGQINIAKDPHYMRGRRMTGVSPNTTPFPKLSRIRQTSQMLYLYDADWYGYPYATWAHPFWLPIPAGLKHEPALNNDRHRGGANFLFMDGHVQFHVTRPLAVDYQNDGVLYE